MVDHIIDACLAVGFVNLAVMMIFIIVLFVGTLACGWLTYKIMWILAGRLVNRLR